MACTEISGLHLTVGNSTLPITCLYLIPICSSRRCCSSTVFGVSYCSIFLMLALSDEKGNGIIDECVSVAHGCDCTIFLLYFVHVILMYSLVFGTSIPLNLVLSPIICIGSFKSVLILVINVPAMSSSQAPIAKLST
jgi:hypothetical protein